MAGLQDHDVPEGLICYFYPSRLPLSSVSRERKDAKFAHVNKGFQEIPGHAARDVPRDVVRASFMPSGEPAAFIGEGREVFVLTHGRNDRNSFARDAEAKQE